MNCPKLFPVRPQAKLLNGDWKHTLAEIRQRMLPKTRGKLMLQEVAAHRTGERPASDSLAGLSQSPAVPLRRSSAVESAAAKCDCICSKESYLPIQRSTLRLHLSISRECSRRVEASQLILLRPNVFRTPHGAASMRASVSSGREDDELICHTLLYS